MSDPTQSRRKSVFVQVRETGRLLALAIRFVWRSSPGLAVLILFLVVIQAVLPPIQLSLSRAVIDSIAYELGGVARIDPAVTRYTLGVWIVLSAVSIGLGQVIGPFSFTLQALAGDRLTAFVGEQVLRAANRWPGISRFEDPTFADDLERVRRVADRAGLEATLYAFRAMVSLFGAAGFVIILASLHPLLPVVIVLASLPAMIGQWEYNHRMQSHLYGQTPDARRLAYYRETLLVPELAKDVRLYGLPSFFRGQYEATFDRTMAALDRDRRAMALRRPLAYASGSFAAAVVYLYVVYLIANDQRSLGDLALYGGAATFLLTTLGMIAFDLGFLPLPLGFLPSLFRILDAPPDLPDCPSPLLSEPRPTGDAARSTGILFDDVSFTYPGGRPVLRGVSFAIRPGECVALVGHNGAGKSTLVKLLLRLYDPTSGRILVDGVDLRALALPDLRRRVGVAFQDFVRYELTVAENIGLGQFDVMEDQDRLRVALDRAGAADLVAGLPDGLHTRLGREFGGRELSGGEWQRLALARTFFRDGSLLVLDEPTAALDVQTEHEVYCRFRELTRGRMTLLISHRFSTVRLADRIVFLQSGHVQEEGTHEELIARGGAYATLFRLQAERYDDAQGVGS